jgi:hypothetical protein
MVLGLMLGRLRPRLSYIRVISSSILCFAEFEKLFLSMHCGDFNFLDSLTTLLSSTDGSVIIWRMCRTEVCVYQVLYLPEGRLTCLHKLTTHQFYRVTRSQIRGTATRPTSTILGRFETSALALAAETLLDKVLAILKLQSERGSATDAIMLHSRVEDIGIGYSYPCGKMLPACVATRIRLRSAAFRHTLQCR